MTSCRRFRSTLTRAGRAHANPPSPPRPPHALPPRAPRPPPKHGPHAANPSPASCVGITRTSLATSTASCSRTHTTLRTRCSSCRSLRRPSTRTTDRSPRNSGSTAAARRTSSSGPSRTSSATPRTALASAPPSTRTVSSHAPPPTPVQRPHPTDRARRCVRERMRPPSPFLRCTDYLSLPASVRLWFHGSRSRPPTIDDQHGRSPPAYRIPPQRPHTVCLPIHHTTLYRLLSALSSLSARPHPAAPSHSSSRRRLRLAGFIVYFLLFFISSVHTIARCSCLCCSPFAFALQVQLPPVVGLV